ncbi:GTPase/DUF3482 domain-containing protein [Candidimonas humi]|uniref:GTPase/DUF3482 domain-containing protein n=1 Tax=Candidimonas humi TaxID=683355 RepID=A0ABV8NX08_9BURK|nr:GTPase/DUF3482 domain-containing protein [Candidimonas humi]MBV6304005.1 GTPase/DUF3482 domain-containing protein [Candidimonas humi]
MAETERARLRLAVVGHTNTGKTSLLRTLTRDPDFGEVRDSPGTTRHVQGARLLVEGQPAVELFDTPGMEDGMALLDYLDQLAQHAGTRLDGPERIRRFLDTPESRRRFEQEARVLKQLLDCDAGLYVVDARDPVLAKHRDELAILAACGKPLLPVLNFMRSPQQRGAAWREALARLGLHASVEFDSVAPALDGEAQLYDKLALLLDGYAGLLRTLKEDIAVQRERRRQDALALIAELLVDAAAWHLAAAADEESVEKATAALRDKLRRRENRCVKALLKLYRFRAADFPQHALPLEGERWGMDLFHPQALKSMGVHVGKGVAAGAMAGATIDAFTAGMSLGAAALAGAAIGGLWQGADRLGKRLLGRVRGYRELGADDAVLRLLGLRQLDLLAALERRGHAAQDGIELPRDAGSMWAAAQADAADGGAAAALRKGRLPEELVLARSQPQWSSLSDDYENTPERRRAIGTLARRLGGDPP